MKKLNMKKITILLMILFCVSVITNAQNDRLLGNGFSIKAVIGFPTPEFGVDEAVESSLEYATLYGLQLGNQWYFAPSEKFGFGLIVNWVDISATVKSVDDLRRGTIDVRGVNTITKIRA